MFHPARALMAAASILLLTSCGGEDSDSGGDNYVVVQPLPGGGTGGGTPTPAPATAMMTATDWEIGPIIKGQNYSSKMPLHPTQTAEGFEINFPYPTADAGHVHYVTRPTGSLANKTRVVIKYRIDGPADLDVSPTKSPEFVSLLTLYFQRKNDDWNTDGYRWWASFATVMDLKPGEHTITADLNANWTSVMTYTATNQPSLFAQAKAEASRIGFTFGGGDGLGHGVFASAESKFVVLDFRVE